MFAHFCNTSDPLNLCISQQKTEMGAESAAVQVLLEKLIAVASEEVGVVLGFEDELKTLQESSKMVQGFLEDVSKRCIQDDEALKPWLQNLDDVAFIIGNLLDEVNYEFIRRQVRMKMKLCGSLISFSGSVAFRRKMGHTMKDANARLKRINEDANSYGLQQRLADSAVSVPIVMETNSFAVDPFFIGRDGVVSTIVHDMIESNVELVVSVVPIVGMGGLGKTTLARNVFNHSSIRKVFSERIWVSVSKKIDNKGLLVKILESLSKNSVQESLGEETVLEQIRSKLEDTRYLLVLDDYLSDKMLEWDNFMNCMKGISPKRGNFIIVTTRNQDVASYVGTHTVPSIDFLSVDDCWSIIKARTFPSQPVPGDFETIGKEIALACQGLPLAANVVGGSLRGKGIDDWKSFQHESGFSKSGPTDDSVLKVLKISFDRLPSSLLKKCFAYCSIFIKGERLERVRLIQLWMAEGLLFENSDGRGDQVEILGDKFYNILLQNFFLHEPIMDKYGRIKYSKMHDFVHDLSCLVEKAKAHNAEDFTLRVRYLPVDLAVDLVHIIREQKSSPRTLFLSKFQATKYIYNLFINCIYLRVLDLHGTGIEELTSSIGILLHLRFLDLSDTHISNLPRSICKLFNLQTLRLIRCWSMRKLPEQLKFLVGLRHLAFSYLGHHLLYRMPPKMGNLTSLRTLSIFIVSDKEGCRIDELGCLKNLEGKLRIWNLEEVSDKEESRRTCLSEKQKIEHLKFVWSVRIQDMEGNNNDCEVLEGLQPHPNLKALTIKNFRGEHFPSWTMKMTVEQGGVLHKLIKIVLIDCEGCQEIPTLGHLPLLKMLRMDRLSNVRSIGPSFYYEDDSSRYVVPFPSLESLTLKDMSSLSDWVEAPNTGATAFPRLEYLKIERCRSMMTGPSHDFPSLKRLYISDVRSEVPLANICKKVSSLAELEITSNSDVPSDLVDMLLRNNQQLQALKISRCDNLTQVRLPDTLTSLVRLEISWCPNLASIRNLKGLSALQHMVIRECDELTELQAEMQ
ncbi:putative disease resistance protein RGA3 [Henckelia pumila]|uniref:putative disease resistance protein RGA3 n=1 Tax=Henckelia pumila TaxID=405737 RepID=UPI003C6E3C76